MLMFLKEQSFTSYRAFARFGTMFQPKPSDCVWADWRVELISFVDIHFRPVRPRVRCTHYPGYMYRKASRCQIFTARCGRQITAAIGFCVWGQPLFPRDLRIAQFFSFKAGVRAAHPVLHQRRHWMSAGDIWPDQSDVPAMCPFRFLNSVIHSQRRPYSICHCLKHVWVQRPFHEQKITNQYEPREQTFCLTSVCVCDGRVCAP